MKQLEVKLPKAANSLRVYLNCESLNGLMIACCGYGGLTFLDSELRHDAESSYGCAFDLIITKHAEIIASTFKGILLSEIGEKTLLNLYQ